MLVFFVVSDIFLVILISCLGGYCGTMYNLDRCREARHRLESSCIEVDEKEEELRKITKGKFKCKDQFGHIHGIIDFYDTECETACVE